MLSDISAIKVAIEICNNPELKKDILCASGSEYDINKGRYEYDRKKQWNEIVEKKATIILRNLGLPEKLEKNVIGVVLSIGMRMLTWAVYHEGTLGFLREYSINFLNSSLFTQQGIIDNKKAAEALMNDKSLSVEQKYKLACLCCFEDHIPALCRQMAKEDKRNFYKFLRIGQAGLVRFWSYYLIGEVDKIKGEKTLDQYRLEKAVESGSKTAVEYCLERTNLRTKKDYVVDAALEAVRKGIMIEKDLIVFRGRRYDNGEETWVPSDYYVDLVSFLLLKMREDQQIEFLKKDIESIKYESGSFEDHRRSRVLEYFLNWPYQVYFMKTAGLMWEFLPQTNYAALLLKICDKIESEKGNILKYGEEKSYDYRGLLKEFWYQSPERYKRCVLSNQEVEHEVETGVAANVLIKLLTLKNFIHEDRNQEVEYRYDVVKAGVAVRVLIKLLTLKNFTHEDRKNIELILASATGKEKENILFSEELRDICIGLIKKEWKILDRIVQICFSSKEEADKFKRDLIFTKEAQRVCIDFVRDDEWNAAELFIKWVALPEEKIKQLKREMIYSADGMQACLSLIQCNKGVERVDRFIRWHFSSRGEVKTFKKELIFSDSGAYKCAYMAAEGKLDLVSEFINLCLSSEKEIRELKKNVAYRTGSLFFEELISDYSDEYIDDGQGSDSGSWTTKFEGGKWEEVEKFLTWCFSSEEEISEFKKHKLLKVAGSKIHFNLIKLNQWEEAETFFTWLGLSAEEIKEFKKETLFHYDAAGEMFSELMYSGEGDEEFVDYGSKQEAIELFLRWFLTDKETVLEFNDEFKRKYQGSISEEDEDVLKEFDLMIEQRLSDLDEEQRGEKRKSETFSPNKKFHNLKLENIGAEYGKSTN